MIGRTHRFHGHKALNGVYQKGRTVRTPLLNLRWASRGSGRPYRVAVVVSRKVSKSAVTRNRIRRRVYAQVREAAGSGKVGPGTDLVFTAFGDDLAGMPAESLRATIDRLLEKAAAGS